MSIHKSVLLQELIEGLQIRRGEVVLDATINGGGMSLAICDRHRNVKVIGIDADSNALAKVGEEASKRKCDIKLWQGNFRNLDQALKSFKVSKVDAMIFDLGLSSNQLEFSGRGFSFLSDEPLLMTFSDDPQGGELTAWQIVNRFREDELRKILFEYGEERFAARIAASIVRERAKKSIERSKELAEIVAEAVPQRFFRKTHPATKTFQALRIAVNDELDALREGLEKGYAHLNEGGRLVVVSFHSLEDRIVKHFMKDKVSEGQGKIITKKPITPEAQEITDNPRSRSAKLRIFEK